VNKTLTLLSLIVLTSSCVREPEACFDLDKQTYSINEDVNFKDCSDYADRYEWDFGDGNRSDEMSPTHRYTESGHYTAVLRTYNKKGEDDFTFNLDVGYYYLNKIDVVTSMDTVTGPRQAICDKLFVTHAHDAFAWGYGGDCKVNFSIVEKSIPSKPSLSLIHYYFVLPDTDVWEGNYIVYDTLYADSNVIVNLDKQRYYEGLHFYGKAETMKLNLDFGFKVQAP
jgi:PKD repeat protein